MTSAFFIPLTPWLIPLSLWLLACLGAIGLGWILERIWKKWEGK